MKYKIYLILLAVLLPVWSCKDVDDLKLSEREVDKDLLSFTADIDGSSEFAYRAEIDRVGKRVDFYFPYYSSDTLPEFTDYSKVRIHANLPYGAVITPSLAGTFDLNNIIPVTVDYVNGERETFDIYGSLKKSSAAEVLEFYIVENPLLTVYQTEEDGISYINIIKTSSSMEEEVKEVTLSIKVSPWAEVDYQPGQIVDLSDSYGIKVIAQDGSEKIHYTRLIQPNFVPEGELSSITLLFGYQITPTEPRGFELDANRSLAVSGNELVVSNINGDFLRFNRFTGVLLNETVNTSGTIAGTLMGIDADDKGILIGVSFAALGNQGVSNQTLEIYMWKDGLDNAPIKLLSKPLTDSSLSFLHGGGEIGRTISVKGDLLSGTAQIFLFSKDQKRAVRYKVVQGTIENADTPWIREYGVNFNNNAKAIPVNNGDDTDFILSGTEADRTHFYCTVDPATAQPIYPSSSGGDYNWWPSDIKGSDYIEFNGLGLLATQNGSNPAYNRLVIANIIPYNSNAFSTNRIMDSRLQNFDPNVEGTQNATLTGFMSSYGALGENNNLTGDVCFGKSIDGSAVQVYMMTTNQGLFAYELSILAD